MQCIKCGKEIAEGELFCVECSLKPIPDVTRKKHTGTEAEGAKNLEDTKTRIQQAPMVQKRTNPPPVKRAKGKLAIALILVSVLAAGLLLWIIYSRSNLMVQRNQLRSAEAVAAEKINTVAQLEAQITSKDGELETLQSQIDDYKKQVEDLKNSIQDQESMVSQSQYDTGMQEKEIQRLEQEMEELNLAATESDAAIAEKDAAIEDLENQIENLNVQMADVETELSDLKVVNESYVEKVAFMDKYIVFIEDDGTKLYHKFECSRFKRENFWAYNLTLAKNNGYHECPICFGG